jgi:hypothetical protein
MRDALPVPIEGDPESGIWTVDGMPMILVPRHFWMAVHWESEKRFGVDANEATVCCELIGCLHLV